MLLDFPTNSHHTNFVESTVEARNAQAATETNANPNNHSRNRNPCYNLTQQATHRSLTRGEKLKDLNSIPDSLNDSQDAF